MIIKPYNQLLYKESTHTDSWTIFVEVVNYTVIVFNITLLYTSGEPVGIIRHWRSSNPTVVLFNPLIDHTETNLFFSERTNCCFPFLSSLGPSCHQIHTYVRHNVRWLRLIGRTPADKIVDSSYYEVK